MTRPTVGIVAVFALTAIVAGIAVLTAGASSERSFTLVVRYDTSSFKTDDVAPKGQSVGDTYAFSGSITRAGNAFGRYEDVDVIVDAKIQGFVRTAMLLLPDGTIAVQGGGGNVGANGWKPGANDALAVVGGTGAYEGARGEIVVRDLPKGTQRLTVDLLG